MSQSDKSKDIWDKAAAITPLLIGILVTGVGAIFTQMYNYQQLQLNKIAALDKLRSSLVSQNPIDREFGYASFVALGFEDLAVRLITAQRDESGRGVLVQLKTSGSDEIRSQATAALQTLDEAQKLVNIFEFGNEKGMPDSVVQKGFDLARSWATATAESLGISSKLGFAILFDAATHVGTRAAGRLLKSPTSSVSTPVRNRDQEKQWLLEYLSRREESLRRNTSLSRFLPAFLKRINTLRDLVEKGDWDLRTISKDSITTVSKQ